MAKKQTSRISLELKKFSEKINELQEYLENNKIEALSDRIDKKETKNGGTITTVLASIEDQIKLQLVVMKDLPNMLDSLDKLREKEEKELAEARGSVEINGMMDDN